MDSSALIGSCSRFSTASNEEHSPAGLKLLTVSLVSVLPPSLVLHKKLEELVALATARRANELLRQIFSSVLCCVSLNSPVETCCFFF